MCAAHATHLTLWPPPPQIRQGNGLGHQVSSVGIGAAGPGARLVITDAAALATLLRAAPHKGIHAAGEDSVISLGPGRVWRLPRGGKRMCYADGEVTVDGVPYDEFCARHGVSPRRE